MAQKSLHSFPLLPLIVCFLTLIRGQYEPYGENVALNKRATQSTTYQYYNASLGVDGNTDTDFDRKTCSHTDTGPLILDAWWMVYLGEFYFIKFITIFQRKNFTRLDGATMYVKGEDGISHQIQLTSHWPSPEFNVSVLLDKRIDEIKLYNNKRPPHVNPFISVCELQAYKVLECSLYTLGNGGINIVTLGEKNQTFTYGAKLKVSCNEGYGISERGKITNETKGIVECKATESWSRNLSCSVIDCGQAMNIPNNSKVISSTGLAGNTSYNATMRVFCDKGFNYTLPGNDTIRCTNGGQWIGILGHCKEIYCGQPMNIPNNSTVIPSNGLARNTSYNSTMRVVCDKGFYYTLPGNDNIRCADDGKWVGILGHCKVIKCGLHPTPPSNSVPVITPGIDGDTSYNATMTVGCTEGYRYSYPESERVRCGLDGLWEAILGKCDPLQEINADEEECKTSLLGWVITGPLCLILLLTNIATCLRFRRHQNSDMETLKNKSNESENNAMESYDNLQMEKRAKSEYDQLTFERESSLITTMKNEI